MIGGVKHHVEACGCDGVTHFGWRVEFRKTGETQPISAENCLLVDDFDVTVLQKISDIPKKKIEVVGAVLLLSGFYNAHMHQVVPHSHESDRCLLKGSNRVRGIRGV